MCVNTPTYPTSIHLPLHYLQSLQDILAQVLKDTACVVYLFGSRVSGRHTLQSDVDIAIAAPGDVDNELSHLREALESSAIPLFVDVVDLRHTDAAFCERVKHEGVVIWTN